jgi:small subunit ribosomal protein S27e
MTGDFLRVACPSCEHEQVLFERAATPVTCGECGEVLAEPAGGTATFRATPVETVEHR